MSRDQNEDNGTYVGKRIQIYKEKYKFMVDI
jgi:hypothetical protein